MHFTIVFLIALAVYANAAPVLENYEKIKEYSLVDDKDIIENWLQDDKDVKEYDVTDEEAKQYVAEYIANVTKSVRSHLQTAQRTAKKTIRDARNYTTDSERDIVEYVSARLDQYLSDLFEYENEETEDCIYSSAKLGNVASVEHINAAKNFAREQLNLFNDLLSDAINDMTNTIQKAEEINSDFRKCADRKCFGSQLLLIREIEKNVKDESFEASVNLVFISPAYMENLSDFIYNHRNRFNDDCNRFLEHAIEQCKLTF